MNQKISVCIATYNGEKYIKEQLMSILPQLGVNDEIIISDDNSTDNTLNIIKSINDNRIIIVTNKGKKGYTPNFENAIKNATGDFIFLSDQDDVWIPAKVQTCMEYFKSVDFIVSDATIIDDKGNIIYNSFFSIRNPYSTLLGNIFKFGYLGCCMAFKRKIIKVALPFPKKHKLCTHDNWLFLVSKTYYNVKIVNEKLIKYRRHNNNISSGGIKNTTSLCFKVLYRLYLIYHLLLLINKNNH